MSYRELLHATVIVVRLNGTVTIHMPIAIISDYLSRLLLRCIYMPQELECHARQQ